MLAETYNPSVESWGQIKNDIISLEKEAFGDKGFSEQELESDFINQKNIIVLLKAEEAKVIGFVYAKPIEEAEPERADEKDETVYLWDIVIKKEYRGQGLTGILLNKIEAEIKARGYQYMDLCAVIANNFAENISKHYKDRIISHEPIESQWGPQIYFRIKL